MSGRINEELLTAYVLNELDENDRNSVENAIQNSPDLMREMETIKMVCGTVRSELLDVPLPELSSSQKMGIRNSLTLGSLSDRFGIRRFFEWRIMTPALCVSVLALLIFLFVPVQMSGKKNTADRNQFTDKNNLLVSATPAIRKTARTKTVGRIGVMDNYQPYMGRDKGYMNNVSSGYLYGNLNRNNNQGLFGGRKLFKSTNSMQYVNREAVPKYKSPHYNLQNYEIIYRNRNRSVADNSQHMVPINANTTGYDNVRRLLSNNQMPLNDAVNIEEMINYFNYDYTPSNNGLPFSVITEISRSPWDNKHKLVHIGFRGNKIMGRTLSDSGQSAGPVTTAKDVRIRLEFDPDEIEAYRLIGYENKNYGKKNIYHNCEMYANEIYAGQTGTVLCELTPLTSSGGSRTNKIITLKLGYRLPGRDQWHIFIYPVAERYVQFNDTSDNFRFSTAVAGFGMLLKNAGYHGDFSYSDVIKIAKGSKGADRNGRRAEFIQLVETAQRLMSKNR